MKLRLKTVNVSNIFDTDGCILPLFQVSALQKEIPLCGVAVTTSHVIFLGLSDAR
jgi:hypothetical protein